MPEFLPPSRRWAVGPPVRVRRRRRPRAHMPTGYARSAPRWPTLPTSGNRGRRRRRRGSDDRSGVGILAQLLAGFDPPMGGRGVPRSPAAQTPPVLAPNLPPVARVVGSLDTGSRLNPPPSAARSTTPARVREHQDRQIPSSVSRTCSWSIGSGAPASRCALAIAAACCHRLAALSGRPAAGAARSAR